eukprot:COSAG01_NODE_1619_length_9715_cov_29.912958_8_plen_114_part_00
MARNSFNGTEGVLLGDENVTYPLPFSAQEQVLVDDMMRSVPSFLFCPFLCSCLAWPISSSVTISSSGYAASRAVSVCIDVLRVADADAIVPDTGVALLRAPMGSPRGESKTAT